MIQPEKLVHIFYGFPEDLAEAIYKAYCRYVKLSEEDKEADRYTVRAVLDRLKEIGLPKPLLDELHKYCVIYAQCAKQGGIRQCAA